MPTTSIGNQASFAILGKKVIIEINTDQPEARGGHTPHLLEEAFSWHESLRQNRHMQPGRFTPMRCRAAEPPLPRGVALSSRGRKPARHWAVVKRCFRCQAFCDSSAS
ncbi:hypothetical protein H4P12_12290 [Paracoccus sp. 11-3]|uniref:Uncharacterized protein n=1 Tax=Paracoccus amoyensis TaxID=2760093 RepID=A0A926GAJ0_9RHOB|nr:hypothetical protein [Paracoccus amoyensis]MBC9247473.1 hypothetical protein [Paracoccus amoyensis]